MNTMNDDPIDTGNVNNNCSNNDDDDDSTIDNNCDDSEGSTATTTSTTATITSKTNTFDTAQRSLLRHKHPKLSWPTWCLRQFTFLFVKFVFCFAFYALQFQSHQIEGPPVNPSLYEHLQEFRKESRQSRHEIVMLQQQSMIRSRKLAENSAAEADRDSMWKPLEGQCATAESSSDLMIDPFPESFDSVFYRAAHEQHTGGYDHYLEHGRENGWSCTRGQYMRDIINSEIIPVLPGSVLEIGPFINPLLRNNNSNSTSESTGKIKYFDVRDWEGSKTKAEELGFIPSPDPVVIDYVDASGDLSVIAQQNNNNDMQKGDVKFSMVVSANVIGVQLNLVRHLQQVGNLLSEGGYYTVLVRDT